MELSTIDYHYLLQEWQALVGGRIQKIYMKDRQLILQIYQKQNYSLLFDDGVGVLTTAKIAFPQTPSGFTMFLRKRFQGTRIKTVEQLGFDRIITIGVETKEGPIQLVIELFGKTNYMVLKDSKIVSAFETHTFSDRTIRGGTAYIPPPSKPVPWEANYDLLVGKEAAKYIAIDLAVGGKYAEEICARAGLDRKHKITEQDIPKIKDEVFALRDHALNPVHNTQEALPFPFQSKQGEWQKTNSFNTAIDAVTREALETVGPTEHQQAQQTRLTKQEKIIAAQKKQLETLQTTIQENQRKGELIYEHYTELQALLAQIKTDWKTLNLTQLKEKYKDHPRIKAIEADGTIEVEL